MKPTTGVLLFQVLVAAGCQHPDPSQKLKPLVDKDIEMWNTGNVSEMNAMIDQHFVLHVNLQLDAEGIDGMKKVISGYRTAYPDPS